MTTKENPAPRANAGNRADKITLASKASNMIGSAPPSLAAHCLANRYRISPPIAAVIARLAELGGTLL